MELKARKLVDKDYDILTTWWNKWPGWSAPSKDFLPNNGTGGLIIEKRQHTYSSWIYVYD